MTYEKDFQDFKDLLVGSASALGQYLREEAIPLFFRDLIDYELEDIENAFAVFRKGSERKMPTAWDIIHLINDRKRPPVEYSLEPKPAPPPEWFNNIHEQIESGKRSSPTVMIPNDKDKETWIVAGMVEQLNEVLDKYEAFAIKETVVEDAEFTEEKK